MCLVASEEEKGGKEWGVEERSVCFGCRSVKGRKSNQCLWVLGEYGTGKL